ncbi:MAG: hypothetical protein HXY21_00240 [Parvularculaceae bacterium]|nr:hypothetical protein [Parvularculaceae bacterium]
MPPRDRKDLAGFFAIRRQFEPRSGCALDNSSAIPLPSQIRRALPFGAPIACKGVRKIPRPVEERAIKLRRRATLRDIYSKFIYFVAGSRRRDSVSLRLPINTIQLEGKR